MARIQGWEVESLLVVVACLLHVVHHPSSGAGETSAGFLAAGGSREPPRVVRSSLYNSQML